MPPDKDKDLDNSHALRMWEQDIQFRQQKIASRDKELDEAHTYVMAALEAWEHDEALKRERFNQLHARNTKSSIIKMAMIGVLGVMILALRAFVI